MAIQVLGINSAAGTHMLNSYPDVIVICRYPLSLISTSTTTYAALPTSV